MNSPTYFPRRKQGAFTLIELLVVIAIIAILAAILFPVFGRARENARRSSCQSNLKQIAMGVMQYVQDFDEKYPQAYWYKDNAGDTQGYVQWSGSTLPYTKSEQIYVCPSDPNKGLTPTKPQDPSYSYAPNGMDAQVPRISYSANAAIMPRKRSSTDGTNTVGMASVQDTAGTIMIAEFNNYVGCINDTSQGQTNTTQVNKSHRSLSAFVKMDGTLWAGQSTTDCSTQVRAITVSEAQAVQTACKAPGYAGGQPHFAYLEFEKHLGGSNYAFADGHVKWHRVEQTLNPSNFMWGKQVHGCSNATVYDSAGNPVK